MPSFGQALLATTPLITLSPLGVKEALFPWVCWRIWTARNHLIFENRVFEPAEILSKAISSAREWSAAQTTRVPSQTPHISRHLPSSLPNTEFVCYTDAAWMTTTNRAGCGWIIQNAGGASLLQGSCVFEYIPSSLMAEALAISFISRSLNYTADILVKSELHATFPN
ncbi:uncharacterized protein LOC108807809 [Raphanus sativus]|uniref:Uncharacterized protein LOC108807809 n=1 Tax=Raphanus sativus TaxID=3726 RepID=A0A6J0JIU1_RAPSA|nr:uncharacterized protein LOC108807809 [Raphanus sativus]